MLYLRDNKLLVVLRKQLKQNNNNLFYSNLELTMAKVNMTDLKALRERSGAGPSS